MAGYLNPIGQSSSVRVLPANRSLVTADSRYRDINAVESESPYNFNAKVSSAIVGKEILYQKLYWDQPLFAHNNLNNELRFQINNDPTVTYVVYATPFTIFTAYDGNAPGTSFLPPKTYSYADGMNQAFNGDVRLLSSNLILANLAQPFPGNLYDANGFQMTVKFLYSPSKGFVITFTPSVNPLIPVYSILLLPCNYIANAHFVHGFGIFDPYSGTNDFVPRNMWTSAYFSDDTPNLLPTRYVTIRSNELTKDRRMISFQNANTSRFQNELAIIALNPIYSGTFHSESVGDDSTVISKRDDYQPSSFRIQIVGEDGDVLECDDPINNMLGVLGSQYSFVYSYLPGGTNVNRGNYFFMNVLLFGSSLANLFNPSPLTLTYLESEMIPSFPASILGGLSDPAGPFPNPPVNNFMWYTLQVPGASGYTAVASNFFYLTPSDLAQSYAPFQVTGSSYLDNQYSNYFGIGQNYLTLPDTSYVPLNAPYNTPQPHGVTQFTWNGTVNPTLGISYKFNLNYFANPGGYPLNTRFGFAVFMYCVDTSQIIAWTNSARAVQVRDALDPLVYTSSGAAHSTTQQFFSFNPAVCTPGLPPFDVPRNVTFGMVAFQSSGPAQGGIVQINYGNCSSAPPVGGQSIRF